MKKRPLDSQITNGSRLRKLLSYYPLGPFFVVVIENGGCLGGAKSPEGRDKNQGEESACKMAAKIPVSSSVPLGSIFPHSLGACHVTYFSA